MSLSVFDIPGLPAAIEFRQEEIGEMAAAFYGHADGRADRQAAANTASFTLAPWQAVNI